MAKEYAFELMDAEKKAPVRFYARATRDGVNIFIGCTYKEQSVEFILSLDAFLNLQKGFTSVNFGDKGIDADKFKFGDKLYLEDLKLSHAELAYYKDQNFIILEAICGGVIWPKLEFKLDATKRTVITKDIDDNKQRYFINKYGEKNEM